MTLFWDPKQRRRPHLPLAASPCPGLVSAQSSWCARRGCPVLRVAPRAGEAAQEVVRLVERALRDSHAVDLEALCVVAGRRVRSAVP
jgi:hypothetical protein